MVAILPEEHRLGGSVQVRTENGDSAAAMFEPVADRAVSQRAGAYRFVMLALGKLGLVGDDSARKDQPARRNAAAVRQPGFKEVAVSASSERLDPGALDGCAVPLRLVGETGDEICPRNPLREAGHVPGHRCA